MKSSFIYILICALGLLACRSGSDLSLESTNLASGNIVQEQQNLVFRFNRALVGDTLIGQTDTLPYIRFEPAVKGIFQWSATDELSFIPTHGFQPSTSYKAYLQPILASKVPALKADFKKAFDFHTPYLQASTPKLLWVMGSKGQPALRLRLSFSSAINPDQLSDMLHLESQNQKLSFELTSRLPARDIDINIWPKSAQQLDKSGLNILIDKGLGCANSKFQTSQAITLNVLVPDREKLEIISSQVLFEAQNPYIDVETSQPVREVKPFVWLEPEPKDGINVEITETGFRIWLIYPSNIEAVNMQIKGMSGIFGGTQTDDFDQTLPIGKPEPLIKFKESAAVYMSTASSRQLAAQIINVEDLQVEVYKIYENNLSAYLKAIGAADGSLNEWSDNESYYYDFGEKIMSRKLKASTLETDKEGYKLIDMSFGENKNIPGIYVVVLRGSDTYWNSSIQTVSISDIGLIARQSNNQLMVFAHSIKTAEPLAQVEISAVGQNNQVVAKGITDAKGAVKFDNMPRVTPGFLPTIVTASIKKDFNFLHFQLSRTQTSRFPVEGYMPGSTGLYAYMYGDRPLYRPGEKLHLHAIVRGYAANGLPAKDMPVVLSIKDPQGKEAKTVRASLNPQGALGLDWIIPAQAPTGTWRTELLDGAGNMIAQYNFHSEEFVPERLKIQTNAPEKSLITASIPLQISCQYLFGPPAAARPYQSSLSWKKSVFGPSGYDNFIFETTGSYSEYENDYSGQQNESEAQSEQDALKNVLFQNGVLDAQGKAQINFEPPNGLEGRGMLEAQISTQVFDETNRAVGSYNLIKVASQNYFPGIQRLDSYTDVGRPVPIKLICLNSQGQPTDADLSIKVVRIEWRNAVRKRNGYEGDDSYMYASEQVEVAAGQYQIQTKGQSGGTLNYIPAKSGEYVVRVSVRGQITQELETQFSAYGYGYTTQNAFEVNREGNVVIETDKQSYQIGQNAKLIFKTPFAGKLLITIEREGVLDYFTLQTDKKVAMLELPIKEAHLPNIYISATLFRPLDAADLMPLTVGHGYANIMVEKSELRLPVEIRAVASSFSGMNQKVEIQSLPESDIEMTLAIVDEGILQIKNTKSSDPYAFFFQKRGLAVLAYDLYSRLFPDIKVKPVSSTGGDEATKQRSARLNQMLNPRIKPLAHWSGILHTDSKGRASHSFAIPAGYSGSLRLMAVAYKNNRFGSAHKNMQVADAVVISTGVARFLSLEDELVVPVTLYNMLNKNADVRLSLQASGPIGLEKSGANDTRIYLKAKQSRVFYFNVKAKNAVGAAKIMVKAESGGRVFSQAIDFNVRPATPLAVWAESGKIEAGQSVSLDMGTDYGPTNRKASLRVSNSPLMQFASSLKMLVSYPYGCAEQTISAAFAQIYFADLAASVVGKEGKNFSAAENVKEAIDKIEAMQVSDGGVAYWESSQESHWWASVYAAHFLTEARKAGYQINNQKLTILLDFLDERARLQTFQKLVYHTSTNPKKILIKNILTKEIPYSVFVLALNNRFLPSITNYYASNTSSLAIDSRYLFAAACQIGGDAEKARLFLPTSTSNDEMSVRDNNLNFYSFVRDQAISLLALIETDPKNPRISTMAALLTGQLRNGEQLSTQENAFALLALGKLAAQYRGKTAKGQIVAGNQPPIAFDKQQNILLSNGQIAGSKVMISASSGTLFYFSEKSGLPISNKSKELDSYLKVRRTFFDRNGKQITNLAFAQNDLITVRISLQTTNGAIIDNIAVSDLLAAGLELENTNIVAQMKAPTARSRASEDVSEDNVVENAQENVDNTSGSNLLPVAYTDRRDDRIVFFTQANGTLRHYDYQVRAVSAGTFELGPISAEAMYDPVYRSSHGAGKVRVLRLVEGG